MDDTGRPPLFAKGAQRDDRTGIIYYSAAGLGRDFGIDFSDAAFYSQNGLNDANGVAARRLIEQMALDAWNNSPELRDALEAL